MAGSSKDRTLVAPGSVPTALLTPEAIERFQGWSVNVHAEFERLQLQPKNPGSDTPATSPFGYLMTTIYKALLGKTGKEDVAKIKALANHFGQSAAGTKAENPAEWLLLASFAAAGPVTAAIRSKCKRWGLLLFYAQQQKIKRKRLIGRLYLDGGYTRINKLMKATNPDLFARRKVRRKPASTHAQKMREVRASRRQQRAQALIPPSDE